MLRNNQYWCAACQVHHMIGTGCEQYTKVKLDEKEKELFLKDWNKKFSTQVCNDVVKEPSHYKLVDGKIEAIELIKDVLTREEFLGYLRGTLMAYHLRANRKNGEEDLRKASIYNNWLIEELDNENS